MHLTCLISAQGPILQCTVLASQARRDALVSAGLPPGGTASANLLIDTGASCTVLDMSIIEQVGLQQTGSTAGHTPSTGPAPVTMPTYDISLILLGREQQTHRVQQFANLPIIGADFSAQAIDGLLGRDVLRHCRMMYAGSEDLVLISF